MTTGNVARMRANWERHLLGLPVSFLLIQLSDKCSLGLYSSLVASRPFDLPEGCMKRPHHVVVFFCILREAVHFHSCTFV